MNEITLISKNLNFQTMLFDLNQVLNISNVKNLVNYPELFNFDDPENIWENKYPELDFLYNPLVSSLNSYIYNFNLPFDLKKMRLDGWCVTDQYSNTHLKKHHHRGHADLVACYYPIAENLNALNGSIEVYDAMDNDPLPNVNHLLITPFEGALLIFPGGSYHRVLPYYSNRICLATNIHF